MTEPDTPRPCPACGKSLRDLPLGATVALACGACGGAWLRGHHLDTELDARVPDGSWMAEFLSDGEPVTGGEGRACPDCARPMNALRWPAPAGSTPVIVERCPSACGAWVDAGEIDRIVTSRLDSLAQVPAAGLLRAMAQEVEQAANGAEPWGLALSDLGDLLRMLGRRAFLGSPVASSLAGLGRTHG